MQKIPYIVPKPPSTWQDLPFFMRELPKVAAALRAEPFTVLPPQDQVFAALEACPLPRTRVVILGQDPYPTPGHAHGLAFSVQRGTPLPRSLSNIFREMENDLGSAPGTGDLTQWARQGVLLLNTALTVPAGVAGGHAKLGWDGLVADVMAALDPEPRAFLLWGKQAQAQARHLSRTHHLVLQSAHPSPLSAHRGFFGSRPFSQVNAWLNAQGYAPIDWITG